MANLKHVGRLVKTGRKVLVVFRTLPGDAYNCLVVATENLSDVYHDALIQAVESTGAQTSFEFAEVLSRSKFPDGSTMLPALHGQKKLLKVPTDQVEMTPNFTDKILLSELNQIIAQQMGVSVSDLAVKDGRNPNVEVTEVATVQDMIPIKKEDLLPPEEKAAMLRKQAEALLSQAANLAAQADALVAPLPSIDSQIDAGVEDTSPASTVIKSRARPKPANKQ